MKYIKLLCLIFLLCACTQERTFFPNDIGKENVEIVRFDQAITSDMTLDSIKVAYPTLTPIFLDYYLLPAMDFMGIFDPISLDENDCLNHYRNDTTLAFKEMLTKMQDEYANMEDIQQSLNNAFAKLKYLYPEYLVPTLYFIPSCMLHNLMWLDNDHLVVGLDFYLGDDFQPYAHFVNQYQLIHMNRRALPIDIMAAVVYNEFDNQSDSKTLLDGMIYEGKLTYLLKQIMDDFSEEEIMSYTSEELAWCKENEANIWHLMINKKDLFSTSLAIQKDYLNDGPFTPSISQEAPSRLGVWIGYRIVRSYMLHNQEISLQDLMAMEDAQQILQESFYKP